MCDLYKFIFKKKNFSYFHADEEYVINKDDNSLICWLILAHNWSKQVIELYLDYPKFYVKFEVNQDIR